MVTLGCYLSGFGGIELAVIPSSEFLRKIISYDPDTGSMVWKSRPFDMFHSDRIAASWNTRFSGKQAFQTHRKDGYLMGWINKTPYLAHRIAWKIFHEVDPEFEIDHINTDKSDNRIANLRKATRNNNQHNRGKSKTNNSGYKGVSLHKRTGKWQAEISLGGVKSYLGLFSRPEDAHNAYVAASRDMHGEFGRF